MLNKLFKHSFLWLILILIFFVFCFSVVPSYKQFQKSFNGDSEKIKYPGFSKKSLQLHEFQKYTETLFEKKYSLTKKNLLVSIIKFIMFYSKNHSLKIARL